MMFRRMAKSVVLWCREEKGKKKKRKGKRMQNGKKHSRATILWPEDI